MVKLTERSNVFKVFLLIYKDLGFRLRQSDTMVHAIHHSPVLVDHEPMY